MPRPPYFKPTDIASLSVWLDASTLGLANNAAVSVWTNKAPGKPNAVSTGLPHPKMTTGVLDGKSVVQFAATAGAGGAMAGHTSQGTSGFQAINWTVVYLSRMQTTPGGRVFSGDLGLTTRNVSVGYALNGFGGADACYDNAWLTPSAGTYPAFPTPWKVHAYISTNIVNNQSGNFYVDGVKKGNTGTAGLGLSQRYILNGYNDGAGTETQNSQVAELCFFTTALTATEHTQVREYLNAKWLNVITQPFNFASASWVKSSATVTADVTAAPDGTMTADKLAATATTAQHFTYWSHSHTDNVALTFSVYFKNAGSNGTVLLWDFNSSAGAVFTIDSDAISPVNSILAATSEPYLPSGWHRISITTQNNGVTSPLFGIYLNGSASYLGDGNTGVFLWGAELVRSSLPSETPWTSVYPSANGTLTATLGNATLASDADLVARGTHTSTLGNVTCVGTGAISNRGMLTRTLGDVTLAGDSDVVAAVVFDRTLGDVTLTSLVQSARSASANITLGDVALTSAVKAPGTGTATPTLGSVTLTSAIAIIPRGTLNRTLGALALTSAVSNVATGTADSELGLLTTDLGATLVAGGVLDQELEPVVAEGLGGFPGAARLIERLDDVTLTSAGNIGSNISLNQFLDPASLDSSVQVLATASLTRTLANLVGNALGAQVNTYTLTATLADVTLFSSGFTYFETPPIRYGSVFAMLDSLGISASAVTIGVRGGVDTTLKDTTLTSAATLNVVLRSVLNMAPLALEAYVSGVAGCVVDATLDNVTLFGELGTSSDARATLALANTQLAGNATAVAKGAATPTLGAVITTSQGGLKVIARMLPVTLEDVALASDGGSFHTAQVDSTLDAVVLDSQGGPVVVAMVNRVLDDTTLVAVAQSPALCALAEVLEDLVGTGALQAYATITMLATLEDATLVMEGIAPIGAAADDLPLDGIGLVAEGQAAAGITHDVTLDAVTLVASGSGEITGILYQVFDDLVGVGEMIHVRRTPILHVFVYVNYVTASIRVESVSAKVTADVAHAVTIVEEEQEYA